MQRWGWRRDAPSVLADTHGRSARFFDYDALADIVAQERPRQNLRDKEFFAIDTEETIQHDDAVSIEEEGSGFRIYSAISAVSRHTQFLMQQLPHAFGMRLSRPKRQFSLKGSSAALVIDLWSDGESAGDAHIYPAHIRATTIPAAKAPDEQREQLLYATNAHKVQTAVSRIMTMHNVLLASWALSKGLAIPLYNNTDGKRFFSIHADGNEGIGRGVRWYTHSTNPLRAPEDRVTDWQVLEYLHGGRSIMSEHTIERYCEYVNMSGSSAYEITH